MGRKRPFFPVYFRHRELIDELEDHEVAQVFRALLVYAEEGTEPQFCGVAKVVFLALRRDVDESLEHYEETCRKNREHVRKRWAKEKQQEQEDEEIPAYTGVYRRYQENRREPKGREENRREENRREQNRREQNGRESKRSKQKRREPNGSEQNTSEAGSVGRCCCAFVRTV